MKRPSFRATPELSRSDLAKAVMWTYDGREFPAPTFQLGMAPAGCMYTTVPDLAAFLGVLFAEGKAADGQPLQAGDTRVDVDAAVRQSGRQGSGFGIGFCVGELDGQRRIGHGGAIYGFATDLAALPDDKLGVVVTASRDVANAVPTTSRTWPCG